MKPLPLSQASGPQAALSASSISSSVSGASQVDPHQKQNTVQKAADTNPKSSTPPSLGGPVQEHLAETQRPGKKLKPSHTSSPKPIPSSPSHYGSRSPSRSPISSRSLSRSRSRSPSRSPESPVSFASRNSPVQAVPPPINGMNVYNGSADVSTVSSQPERPKQKQGLHFFKKKSCSEF